MIAENQSPYCTNCFSSRGLKPFAPPCLHCGKSVPPIAGNKHIFFPDGTALHSFCATCVECDHKLTKDDVAIRETADGKKEVWCDYCYGNSFCGKCAECKEPILGPHVEYDKKNFHPTCLTCATCGSTGEFGESSFVPPKSSSDPVTCIRCANKSAADPTALDALPIFEDAPPPVPPVAPRQGGAATGAGGKGKGKGKGHSRTNSLKNAFEKVRRSSSSSLKALMGKKGAKASVTPSDRSLRVKNLNDPKEATVASLLLDGAPAATGKSKGTKAALDPAKDDRDTVIMVYQSLRTDMNTAITEIDAEFAPKKKTAEAAAKALAVPPEKTMDQNLLKSRSEQVVKRRKRRPTAKTGGGRSSGKVLSRSPNAAYLPKPPAPGVAAATTPEVPASTIEISKDLQVSAVYRSVASIAAAGTGDEYTNILKTELDKQGGSSGSGTDSSAANKGKKKRRSSKSRKKAGPAAPARPSITSDDSDDSQSSIGASVPYANPPTKWEPSRDDDGTSPSSSGTDSVKTGGKKKGIVILDSNIFGKVAFGNKSTRTGPPKPRGFRARLFGRFGGGNSSTKQYQDPAPVVIRQVLFGGDMPYLNKKESAHVGKLESLEWELVEPDLAFVDAYVRAVEEHQRKHLDRVSRNLIQIFESHNCSVMLLNNLIYREIIGTDNVNTLFRADNAATKMAGYYAKLVGLEYVSGLLGPIVHDIIVRNAYLETDPDRWEGPGNAQVGAERNAWVLMATTQKIFTAIVRGVSTMPAPLRMLCSEMASANKVRFPDSPHTSVASFLFLRFFCPAISSPNLFGMADGPPPSNAFRFLILIAKVLQSLANDVPMQNARGYLDLAAEFVDENRPTMRWYYETVSTPPGEDYYDTPPVEMPKSVLPAALLNTHRVLDSVETEMLSILKDENPATRKRVRTTLAQLPTPPAAKK